MENHQISPQEIKNRLRNQKNDFLIVDIRDVNEYRTGILGSMNVPINSFMAMRLQPDEGRINQTLKIS
jgi:rhodanese-related sulfurtransferase